MGDFIVSGVQLVTSFKTTLYYMKKILISRIICSKYYPKEGHPTVSINKWTALIQRGLF